MAKYATRTYACTDCGQVVTRKRKTTQPMVCVECGITHSLSAIEGMRAKAGPSWDNWLASNADGAPGPRTNE